jgi:hypothetical protein
VVSFDAYKRLAAAALLGVAASGSPCAALAQTASGSAAENAALGEIAARISEAQLEGGAYSSDLIDPLKTLSVLYQESGNHMLAAAVLDQAMQVIRANYGLRSLEQAPLLQQRIRSEEARGNATGAWELEQELLVLAQRNPHDLRSAPILHELGDKRMEVLERYLGGELPPQLFLGCYYQGLPQDRLRQKSGSCTAGSKQVAAGTMLVDAQRLYLNAIRVFHDQKLYSSEELRELETKVIHGSYSGGAYQLGRQSLQRLISYDTANSEPLERRVDTLVQIGDWDLLFDRRPSALDIYEETYAFLLQRGDHASIDALFSAAKPRMLPTFVPDPSAPERAASATGHVDLAFEVTRYGTTRRLEVLETSSASKDGRSDILRLVSRARFRPVVSDGEFARATPYVVRYFVEE